MRVYRIFKPILAHGWSIDEIFTHRTWKKSNDGVARLVADPVFGCIIGAILRRLKAAEGRAAQSEHFCLYEAHYTWPIWGLRFCGLSRNGWQTHYGTRYQKDLVLLRRAAPPGH